MNKLEREMHDEFHYKGYSYENMIQYHKLMAEMGFVIRPRIIIALNFNDVGRICAERRWPPAAIYRPSVPSNLYGYKGQPCMMAGNWQMLRDWQQFYMEVQQQQLFLIDEAGNHINVDGKVLNHGPAKVSIDE